MEKTQQKKRQKGLLRRFAPYFKKYIAVLIFDLFCAALTTVCELALPLIVEQLTDLGINDLASLTLGYILRIGALYIFLKLVDVGATFFMASIGHIMGTKIETDMRRDLFAHLQKLSFAYFDNTKVGQIMSRITTDLFDVTEFAHHCPEEFFIAGIKIIGSFVILCTMSIPLTLIIFAVLPFMLIAATYFNRKMQQQFRYQRQQLGEINAQVEDSLLGVRVVKSFANEPLEEEKFEKGNMRFYNIKRKRYLYMGGFEASNKFFDGLMYIVVVIAGAIFMMNRAIEPSQLVAYLLYITTLINSIHRIVQFTEQFQSGMTGVERFFQIMDADVDIFDEPGAVDIGTVKGDVSFEHVGFSYMDDGTEVLSNINLDVKAGENIALVGPSGGGKTTLCNLIPRFYDTTEGTIRVDGKDIRSVTLKSLRGQIGFVQQDVYLFSGTVFENIQYGKPGASREEVIEAAKMAGAHEFIESLSNGYDTYVGERGVKLSGGQKQRISIARAFLKNPPILILDEATSALDNESERIVQESLEKLAKGRTTFTIAHRLTTIKNATKILVLTNKGIEESGTHKELMHKKGIYYGLYNSYTEMMTDTDEP
ncbi:MAG: ABC transporter ATP-binding protein [Hominenteromicrobium sp.]